MCVCVCVCVCKRERKESKWRWVVLDGTRIYLSDSIIIIHIRGYFGKAFDLSGMCFVSARLPVSTTVPLLSLSNAAIQLKTKTMWLIHYIMNKGFLCVCLRCTHTVQGSLNPHAALNYQVKDITVVSLAPPRIHVVAHPGRRSRLSF